MNLKQYEKHLMDKGIRPDTIQKYLYNIGKFFEYCGKRKPTPKLAESFLMDKSGGMTGGTLRMIYYSLLSYFKATNGRGFAFDFPLPRLDSKIQPTFTETEIKNILASARKKNMRDYIILRLLYVSGITRGEFCGITKSDVRIRDGYAELTVRRPKAGSRRVIIDVETAKLVKNIKKQGYKHPFNLKETMLNHIVTKYKKKAKIKKKGGPQAIRRSFTSHVYERGVDSEVIQKILGDSSSEGILKYISLLRKRYGMG